MFLRRCGAAFAVLGPDGGVVDPFLLLGEGELFDTVLTGPAKSEKNSYVLTRPVLTRPVSTELVPQN